MSDNESTQITPAQLDLLIQQDLQWIEDREGPFCLWIDALWPSHLDIPFNDKREVFFHLLRVLLDSGKVYLAQPADAPFGERRVLNADVWAAPHDYITEYVRQHLPKDLIDHDDMALTDFWYDIHCPRLLWYDPDDNSLYQS